MRCGIRNRNNGDNHMSNILELPETFDPGAHEGTRDLEPMPIGWYQAQIVESEVRDASNGNGTYLLAVFQILEASIGAARSSRT